MAPFCLGYNNNCSCKKCIKRAFRESDKDYYGGTFNSTAFKSGNTQHNDPSVTNTYFNGPGDGPNHGHVKYRDNPDGTTDYLYVRDVEGNEYDV